MRFFWKNYNNFYLGGLFCFFKLQPDIALGYYIFEYRDVNADILQRRILRPLLFLVYVNYLLDEVTSNPRLFADNTLFSVIHDDNLSQTNSNADFHQIKYLGISMENEFYPWLIKECWRFADNNAEECWRMLIIFSRTLY